MSEQPNEPPHMPQVHNEGPSQENGPIDSARSASRPAGAQSTGMQSLGMQQCPSCGARNHANASICLACGEQLRQRPKKIRCRQCGHQASSSLTICPDCGRELHAAPSRFWTWVVPLVVALALALFFLSRVGGPMSWAKSQVGSAAAWVSGMGQEMDPHVTMIMTPESDTPMLELIEADAVTDGDGSGTGDSDATDADVNSEAVIVMLPTNTAAALPTDTPQPAPTATPTETPASTPTKEPTATSPATPTKLPTATKTPTKQPKPSATEKSATSSATLSTTPTTTMRTATRLAGRPTSNADDAEATAESALVILQPTKTPESTSGSVSAAAIALVPTSEPADKPTETRTYTVLAGDTLLSIAERFGTTVDLLMMANDIAPNEAFTLRVGETLTIISDDDAPLTQTYTIRAGDTFVTIASRFNVSTSELQLANGFSNAQVRLLRPGQTLIIPAPDNEASSLVALAPTATSASPTVRPTASPTPNATPVPTAIPTATLSPLRLDAPVLRSPENNTVVSCQGNGQMAWSAVNFVLDTDEYVMHLGFVSNRDAGGSETITWVLNQQRPSNRTSWEMDPGLCGLAPQEYGRQWRWYVEVVDEEGVAVSPPSETWSFSWN